MRRTPAEQFSRFHYLDNAKFCSNSRGSCWETLDRLITAHDEDMIPETMLAKGRSLVKEAVRLLNVYMSYLKKAARPEAE